MTKLNRNPIKKLCINKNMATFASLDDDTPAGDKAPKMAPGALAHHLGEL